MIGWMIFGISMVIMSMPGNGRSYRHCMTQVKELLDEHE